jgi:hypothetical protein
MNISYVVCDNFLIFLCIAITIEIYIYSSVYVLYISLIFQSWKKNHGKRIKFKHVLLGKVLKHRTFMIIDGVLTTTYLKKFVYEIHI